MKRPFSPALRFGSAAFVLVMATLFCGAGCGAASPTGAGYGDSKVTSAPVSPETPPQNLGEAEAQFAAAEQYVFGALNRDKREEPRGGFATPPGQMAQQAPQPTATTTDAAPPPPPKDSDRAFKEGEAKPTMSAGATAAGAEAQSFSSSPCETACRALASMNRAATHICSLAGDDSEHCSNARERVRAATERVRQSCSECSQ